MTREEVLLNMLVESIPRKPNEFNCKTGFDEPQHWMSLPNGRSLEITYEETGDDNRYYLWRIHCNEKEFDNYINGIIDERISWDMYHQTRLKNINWAIDVALN